MTNFDYRDDPKVSPNPGKNVTVLRSGCGRCCSKALHVDPNSTKKRASPEEKLRAIAKAYRHQHPTADIEVMLAEIEAGRNL